MIAVAYIASVMSSPCAKLTTRITPKITDRPSAISPYTRPVSKPATTTLTTRSAEGIGCCFAEALRFVLGRGEHELRLRERARQGDRRLTVEVLNTRRADAFDLALRIEANRTTE